MGKILRPQNPTRSVAQFVIRNPNATTTCGCGNSFAV
jgi:Fe-S cluster assembly iron-binding protein IscA